MSKRKQTTMYYRKQLQRESKPSQLSLLGGPRFSQASARAGATNPDGSGSSSDCSCWLPWKSSAPTDRGTLCPKQSVFQNSAKHWLFAELMTAHNLLVARSLHGETRKLVVCGCVCVCQVHHFLRSHNPPTLFVFLYICIYSFIMYTYTHIIILLIIMIRIVVIVIVIIRRINNYIQCVKPYSV